MSQIGKPERIIYVPVPEAFPDFVPNFPAEPVKIPEPELVPV